MDSIGSTAPADWRAMVASDLDRIVALADAAFPDHRESIDIFAEKLRLYPGGCFVVPEGQAGIGGYVFAHPYRLRQVPALDAKLGALPDGCDCIYIHDMTLAPDRRGQGLASRMLRHLADHAAANGYKGLALTSLAVSTRYWRRSGFVSTPVEGGAGKLASYGAGADYMTRLD